MALTSEGWFSLPTSSQFAGACEQPRAPMPTAAAWPPPPARGSAPPPTPAQRAAPPPPPSGVRVIASKSEEWLDSDLLVESEADGAPEPIVRLLEDVGDLELLGGRWQAAAFAAAVLQKTFQARAVVVHELDEARSELRVIAVKGAHVANLLGEILRVDDDFVGSTVVANRRPLVMSLVDERPRVLPARFATLGATGSLVAVPFGSSGRCAGVIEVIDATEDTSTNVADACSRVAERMAPLFAK